MCVCDAAIRPDDAGVGGLRGGVCWYSHSIAKATAA